MVYAARWLTKVTSSLIASLGFNWCSFRCNWRHISALRSSSPRIYSFVYKYLHLSGYLFVCAVVCLLMPLLHVYHLTFLRPHTHTLLHTTTHSSLNICTLPSSNGIHLLGRSLHCHLEKTKQEYSKATTAKTTISGTHVCVCAWNKSQCCRRTSYLCTCVAAQLSKPAESAKKPCAAQLAFHFAATNWFCLLWCLQIYRRLRIFMNMHVLTYTHMYTYTAIEMYACKRQIEQSRAISTLTSYIWYYSCPQYINTYPPYIQALSTHTCAHSSDFHFSKCHWSFLCIDWFPLFQCRKLKKLIARPFIRGPQAAFQYLVRAHCATIYYKRRYSREDRLPEK